MHKHIGSVKVIGILHGVEWSSEVLSDFCVTFDIFIDGPVWLATLDLVLVEVGSIIANDSTVPVVCFVTLAVKGKGLHAVVLVHVFVPQNYPVEQLQAFRITLVFQCDL